MPSFSQLSESAQLNAVILYCPHMLPHIEKDPWKLRLFKFRFWEWEFDEDGKRKE